MSEIIIGIAGPARSGKNEISKYLVKYHSFHEDSFAMPIRQSAIALLGLSGLDELDDIKQEPHDTLGGKTPREYMQLMGTEFGRNMVFADIWVRGLINRTKKYERVVISDVRFDNEAEAIKSAGGIIIHVDRPTVRIEQSSHASEAGINPKMIDFRIINDETLDDLYKNIETTMRMIFKKVYK